MTRKLITESSLPDESIEGLGRVRHRLRPNRWNLAAGMTVASLIIAGGLTMIVSMGSEVVKLQGNIPIYSEHGMCWSALAGMVLLFCGMLLGAGALFRWALSRWGLCVSVCEQGFEWRSECSAEQIPWDQIQRVREFRPGDPVSNDFEIELATGRTIRLTRNDLENHRILGQIAKSEAEVRSIPVETT